MFPTVRANRILKTCSKCGESKVLGDFHYDRSQADNRRPKCKKCTAQYDKVRKQELIKRDSGSYYKGQYKRTLAYMANSPRKALYSQLRSALKRRPSDNPATLDDLLEVFHSQEGKCALTGEDMVWSGRHMDRENLGMVRYNSMSLDRVNQNLGYSKGNVRLVLNCMNSFRGRMTDERMYSLAEALLANKKTTT